jgi:hypothetical protein
MSNIKKWRIISMTDNQKPELEIEHIRVDVFEFYRHMLKTCRWHRYAVNL